MKKPFFQGWLDSLCGIYSIVNCDKILNRSTSEESQELFNNIIGYLSKKRKLKDILIGGVYHKDMVLLLETFSENRFYWKTIGNGFKNINEYWDYSSCQLSKFTNSCIILSIGGIDNHLTVAKSMSDKKINLFDSSGYTSIRKSSCKIYPYFNENKYIIYPSQSFICWKE